MKKLKFIKLFLIILTVSLISCFTFSCKENESSTINSSPDCVHSWKSDDCTLPAVCELCGKAQESPIGHTEVVDAAKAPTCTESGLTEGKHCSVCGEVTVKQKVVPATGHTEVVDLAKAPTCTESGLTEGKHCSVCGEILNKQEKIDKLGHSFKDKKCSICGEWEYSSAEYFTFSLLRDNTYEVKLANADNTPADLVIPREYEGKPVSRIASYAFYMNDKISYMVIPSTVTAIGDSAFLSCVNLTDIVIGNGVTTIEGYAFYNCTKLTSVTLPNSLTAIGAHSFRGCTGLASIVIPNNVTSIGVNAFNYCTSLTSATIGDGVTHIPSDLFDYCVKLQSLWISKSVTSMGHCAFSSCGDLVNVNYAGSIDDWAQIEFDGVFSNPLYYANTLIIQGEQISEVVLKEATKISAYAFVNSNIKSIKITSSVTSIGISAFEGCEGLQTVYYGGNLQDWENIVIEKNNEALINAERIYDEA